MSKEELNPNNLTPEAALTILHKVISELQEPSNVKKLEDAKDNVGNEMLKMMQYIFPIVMQVEMDVIKDFGFPEGREGIVKFAQMLRSLEREDAEVLRVHNLIKSYYLPAISVNATNESPNDDRIGGS